MLIFFTIYDLILKRHIKNLPTTYQNKSKIPGKNRECLVHSKELASYVNYIQVMRVKFLVEMFRV